MMWRNPMPARRRQARRVSGDHVSRLATPQLAQGASADRRTTPPGGTPVRTSTVSAPSCSTKRPALSGGAAGGAVPGPPVIPATMRLRISAGSAGAAGPGVRRLHPRRAPRPHHQHPAESPEPADLRVQRPERIQVRRRVRAALVPLRNLPDDRLHPIRSPIEHLRRGEGPESARGVVSQNRSPGPPERGPRPLPGHRPTVANGDLGQVVAPGQVVRIARVLGAHRVAPAAHVHGPAVVARGQEERVGEHPDSVHGRGRVGPVGDPAPQIAPQNRFGIGPVGADVGGHGREGPPEGPLGAGNVPAAVSDVAQVRVAPPPLGQSAPVGQRSGLIEASGFDQVADALAEHPVVAGDLAGQRVEGVQQVCAQGDDLGRFLRGRPVLLVVVPDAQPPDDLVARRMAAPQRARKLASPAGLETGLEPAGVVAGGGGVGGGPDGPLGSCGAGRGGHTRGAGRVGRCIRRRAGKGVASGDGQSGDRQRGGYRHCGPRVVVTRGPGDGEAAAAPTSNPAKRDT